MGCRVLPYWIGTFVYDYALYLLLCFVFMIIALIFQATYLLQYAGPIILLLIVFGLTLITLSYVLSFMF